MQQEDQMDAYASNNNANGLFSLQNDEVKVDIMMDKMDELLEDFHKHSSLVQADMNAIRDVRSKEDPPQWAQKVGRH